MNALIEPRADDDDTEERVDEIAALGVDKEDDMLEDLLANGADEPGTEEGTAADSPIVAEMGGITSGSARASADEESKAGDASTAESVDAAAADDGAGKSKQQTNNYHISDYPGFEGIKMSMERAVKLMFSRLGTKAAERMRRVMNKLKAGTCAGSAAEPVDLNRSALLVCTRTPTRCSSLRSALLVQHAWSSSQSHLPSATKAICLRYP